ncbi:FAD/NAD(P)-binding domain-containing protein [Dendrothele bispora CBS 962.96]|uniref:FAD/NAD(P)-binding domain-containing protein n=1 Tax=Dendrothele bispora (strain CBS 962.96) TaxID=1314807 RepID=A0A4S8LR91_DENBC|nr:FAD/NAD(P)-binding domain-containing protein [Dendrothele bispora CBS 962.96]
MMSSVIMLITSSAKYYDGIGTMLPAPVFAAFKARLDSLQLAAASGRRGQEPKDKVPIPDSGKGVGIVGGGVSGLYAAMMLQSVGIGSEILEATDDVGGRLYTYHFDKSRKPGGHEYFDVGALRFPETPMMKRTFHLFKILQDKISQIEYKFRSPNSTLLYNAFLKQNGTPLEPTLIKTDGSEQIKWWCLDGGSQTLAYAMREHLKRYGGLNLSTSFGVSSITLSSNGKEVEVKSTREQTKRYNHVITTTTLSRLRVIDLDRAQNIALRELQYGAATKIGIQFETQWWTNTNSQVQMPFGPDSWRLTVLINSNDPEACDILRDLVFRDLIAIHGLDPKAGYKFLEDQNVYRYLTIPAAKGRQYFAGEGVVDALSVSWRAVHQIICVTYPEKKEAFYALWGRNEDWSEAVVLKHLALSARVVIEEEEIRLNENGNQHDEEKAGNLKPETNIHSSRKSAFELFDNSPNSPGLTGSQNAAMEESTQVERPSRRLTETKTLTVLSSLSLSIHNLGLSNNGNKYLNLDTLAYAASNYNRTPQPLSVLSSPTGQLIEGCVTCVTSIKVYDSARNTTGNMHIRLECEGSLFGLERNKGQKNKFKCESYFVSVRIGVPDNGRGQRKKERTAEEKE